jgi:hypothetical protein
MMLREPITSIGANMTMCLWADLSEAVEGTVNMLRIYDTDGVELYSVDVVVSAQGQVSNIEVDGDSVFTESRYTDLSGGFKLWTIVSTPLTTSLYLEGSLVASGVFTHGSLVGAKWAQWGADGFETPVDGGELSIFDRRIYAKALTANAIKELWRDGNSGKFGYNVGV